MWISQTAYLKTVEERQKLVAALEAAKQLTAAQRATTEFLMLRVTQLEAERNKLLWTFAGVKFPELMVAAEPAGEKSPLDNPLNAIVNFGDMGDEEAAKRGIGWNNDGTLTYGQA